MIGIYPGSFDPITFGHLDIIERASKITDKLIVAVLNNKNKNHLFSASERADLVAKSITHLNNVSVEIFDGLLVDFAKQKEVSVIIRGIRAVMDFEYELAFSQTNKELNKNIDTLFLMTNIKYSYLSSSAVKEVASYGGDISKFVPNHVISSLKKKLNL